MLEFWEIYQIVSSYIELPNIVEFDYFSKLLARYPEYEAGHCCGLSWGSDSFYVELDGCCTS